MLEISNGRYWYMHEKPDATDTENGQEISVLDVLNFLNKYKKAILGVALIAGILAAAIAMQMPNVYTAKLKLIPPAQGQLIQPALESESFAEILARRFNLTQVYGVKNIIEARNQLMEYARFKLNKDTTITVEVDDADPQRAAALVNAYPEELDKFIVSRGLSDALRRQEKIKVRIQDLQAQLDIINKKLGATEKRLPVNALIVEKEKRANIATLRAQLDLILEGDASITKAMPSLDRLREQIDRLFQPTSMVAEKTIGSAERDYLEQFSQAQYLEVSAELLKRRLAQFALDEQMNKTRVLDLASVPESKSKPKRLLIVGSAMLAAAFLTILLLLLREWMVNIRTQERQAASAQ
jgi:uncharacterized protein involved in exopolysaccharide biosynthesis